jgi:hypothetical protein
VVAVKEDIPTEALELVDEAGFDEMDWASVDARFRLWRTTQVRASDGVLRMTLVGIAHLTAAAKNASGKARQWRTGKCDLDRRFHLKGQPTIWCAWIRRCQSWTRSATGREWIVLLTATVLGSGMTRSVDAIYSELVVIAVL